MAGKRKAVTEIETVETADQLYTLMKRCDKGEQGTHAQLRRVMADSRSLAQAIDLSENTERVWLDKTLGEAKGTKECCKAHLREMRRELGGPNPTLLERLLVTRISLCWLQTQYADTIYAENMATCSQRAGEYLQRRQESAHRRFLSAVKALAQVRRLSVPLIQLNVADKQINMLSSQGPGENTQGEDECDDHA